MARNVILEEPRPVQGMASAPVTGHPGAMWARVTALGGLVFFGLFVGFAALTSNTPAATDTRQEVFSYLARHHDRLQLAAALYGLAMLAALLFLSGLFATLRKAEGCSASKTRPHAVQIVSALANPELISRVRTRCSHAGA
jgi:hypothetical protein